MFDILTRYIPAQILIGTPLIVLLGRGLIRLVFSKRCDEYFDKGIG